MIAGNTHICLNSQTQKSDHETPAQPTILLSMFIGVDAEPHSTITRNRQQLGSSLNQRVKPFLYGLVVQLGLGLSFPNRFELGLGSGMAQAEPNRFGPIRLRLNRLG